MDGPERFAAHMALPSTQVALDEVGLLIAGQDHPVDVESIRGRLDELAVVGAGTTDPGALVAEVLEAGGLRGDDRDYYDPQNSFIDRVLERRIGIPISLAVVLVCVASRIGRPLQVVGMPGHVLVAAPDAPGRWYDPFDGGRSLDLDGALELQRRVLGDSATDDPASLVALDAHQVVHRQLSNLRAIYARRGDRASLAWVLGLLTSVPGAPDEHRVELALVLGAQGRVLEAAEVLEVLADRVDGERADELRRSAVRLRARAN